MHSLPRYKALTIVVYALQRVRLGENVFVTGGPGSGKTEWIQRIKDFTHYVMNKRAIITSTTAQSASIIEVSTLHSTMCLGMGNLPVTDMVNRITKSIELNAFFLKLEVPQQ